MTTYNTGNPVGSVDVKDLYDNAQNLDRLVNDRTVTELPDRLGNPRKTWHGMEQDFAAFLVASGYQFIGDYDADGPLTITRQNQIFSKDGEYWRSGPALALPYTTVNNWVIDQPKFVSVGDAALRQDLAAPDGATRVGRGGSTVDADLTSLEGRTTVVEGKLNVAPYRLTAIARETQVNRLSRFDQFAQRIVSKGTAEAFYDHFGIMDMTPKGELYLIFRRGTVHTGGSDGFIAFRKYQANGTWGPVSTIAQQIGQDFRAAAGGTMPTGRIVVSGTIWSTGDLYVYASDDYGDTWQLKTMIPKGTTDYRLSYGRAIQVGDKFILPYYSATGGGTAFQLRWLETTDGGDTWVEGATVYNGATEYNEADYVNMGGGAVLCVVRKGTGAGGKMRQLLTMDNGATWVDQGDVTAQNDDSTDVVVSPSLSYVYSEGGTPHVVLYYTNRTTSFCYYRTNLVSRVTQGAGVGNLGWSDRNIVYSAPTSSGYQSQIVLGNRRILGNIYREATATVSRAFQFETYLGSLPDYVSDWTAVSASSIYTFAHGLQRPPRKVIVEFATSTNPTTWNVVMPTYFNDGANKGSGAQIEIGATNIRVGTGSAVWGTGYFGGFDNNVSNRVTSGYYRVRAWI